MPAFPRGEKAESPHQVTTKFPHMVTLGQDVTRHPGGRGTRPDGYQISSHVLPAVIVAGRYDAGLSPDASFRDLFTLAAWARSHRSAAMGWKVRVPSLLREWIW